jgi:hypothetical protein
MSVVMACLARYIVTHTLQGFCGRFRLNRWALLKTSLASSLILAAGTSAQQIKPADTQLSAIAGRGRALAAYDRAAWHASDAVQMANPETAEGQHCLARFANERWTVVFGYLNPEKTKFLITYEATEGSKPQSFTVSHDDPAKEDTAFYLFAARALEVALADFGRTARPYNAAILPATDGQLYAYLYPAQLKAGAYPFGGDVRYLISPDGQKILEKRQLHKMIIETAPPAKNKKAVAGFHSHTLSEVPEDTDVLHVLQQDPPLPEMIGTTHFVYEVTADGSIRIKQEKAK